MPRLSQKAILQRDLANLIQDYFIITQLDSDSDSDSGHDSDLEDLIEIYDIIAAHRYLDRSESGGRHDSDALDKLVHEYPETSFLALFRMHRASFWHLVELLSIAGGESYWGRREPRRGRPARPVYQQVAVALYVMGGKGGGEDRNRIESNIGKGTVLLYLWRTIDLLARLLPEHVRWPIDEERAQRDPPTDIFRKCIGFLDSSIIILQEKPKFDPEAYISRKNNYGFNLQAICDWEGQFIWASMGHTASVDDSTAFKCTALYQNQAPYFKPDEYLLADKAYELERHIVTPYKEPASRQRPNAAFNYELSIPRLKIEHAFGVLKARWPSLNNLPIRFNEDKEKGHNKVIDWTMACLVLHNLLAIMRDDESWLQEEIEAAKQAERANNEVSEFQELQEPQSERETVEEAKRAGHMRREELRGLMAQLRPRGPHRLRSPQE